MPAKSILVLGATGTIGRAVVAELTARDHEVVAIVRPQAGDRGSPQRDPARLLPGVELCFAEITDPAPVTGRAIGGRRFDAVISCLASRSGVPRDAWAIDYQAQMNALSLAIETAAEQMVLLSAICVQKPRLAFQHAKLAFEKALIDSGLTYSIVRPTAFFKSLSGQIARLQQGKPFLVFGDGRLTACKPISDADLAAYIADCLQDASLHNRILPIGGPGPAITPLQQGECLFELLNRAPHFKRVPVSLLSTAAALLSVPAKLLPPLAAKAELARIGHYYATESMLLLDPETGLYDADATPETGRDTLQAYYRRVIGGDERVERGEHAVF
ncbi:MAG: NAD(P)H-binding protein [Gammaproteobacteria bacterium]|jgi:divinyl chlorophyllide a 8-vinyl-reductase